MRYVNRYTVAGAAFLVVLGVTGYQKRNNINAFFARHMPVASGELDRRVAAEINSNNEAMKKAYDEKVGALEGRIETTTKELTSFKSNSEKTIEELRQQLANALTQEAYNALRSEIGTQISGLTERVNAIPSAADIPDYSANLAALRKDVDDLTLYAERLGANYTEQQAQIAKLLEKIGAVKVRESKFKNLYSNLIDLLTKGPTEPNIRIVSIREAPGGVQSP